MDAFNTTEFGIGGSWLAEYTLTAIGAGLVVFDGTGRATQWDQHGPRLLGVTEEQLAGRALHDADIGTEWQHGARITSDDDPVLAVLESGESACGRIIRVVDLEGAVTWRSLNLVPVFGIDRAPRAVLASVTDMTAVIEARTANTSWHLALRAIVRAGVGATVLIDRSGEILECNDQLLELTGRTELELLSCRFTDVCDVDVDWLWTELEDADDEGVQGPTWLLRSNGHEMSVRGRFSLLDHPALGRVAMAQLLPPGDSGGCPSGRSTCGAAFERSIVPMLVVTDAGLVVDANPAAANELGGARSQLAGEPAVVRLPGLDPSALRQAIGNASLAREPVTAGTCRVAGDDMQVFVSSLPDMPELFLVQLLTSVSSRPSTRPPEGRPVA